MSMFEQLLKEKGQEIFNEAKHLSPELKIILLRSTTRLAQLTRDLVVAEMGGHEAQAIFIKQDLEHVKAALLDVAELKALQVEKKMLAVVEDILTTTIKVVKASLIAGVL